MIDIYNGPIVFELGPACRSIGTYTPYSTGPNTIDECGKGDDIVIGWATRFLWLLESLFPEENGEGENPDTQDSQRFAR